MFKKIFEKHSSSVVTIIASVLAIISPINFLISCLTKGHYSINNKIESTCWLALLTVLLIFFENKTNVEITFVDPSSKGYANIYNKSDINYILAEQERKRITIHINVSKLSNKSLKKNIILTFPDFVTIVSESKYEVGFIKSNQIVIPIKKLQNSGNYRELSFAIALKKIKPSAENYAVKVESDFKLKRIITNNNLNISWG